MKSPKSQLPSLESWIIPPLPDHSTGCHFTWCLLWALNVVHLKRRLRIIQWQHVAPFSPQKEQESVDGDHNCATCGSLWSARPGTVKCSLCSQIEALKRGGGKMLSNQGLAKKTKATMPKRLRRPSPTLRSQMVCVCLFLLKVNWIVQESHDKSVCSHLFV